MSNSAALEAKLQNHERNLEKSSSLVDALEGAQQDLTKLIQQSHAEFIKELDDRFSSLREELLVAISELPANAVPPSGRTVEGTAGRMAEDQSQGISDVYYKLDDTQASPHELDVTNSNESPKLEIQFQPSLQSASKSEQNVVSASKSEQNVAKRQASRESTMSVMNIFDPAEGSRRQSENGSMTRRSQQSVRVWNQRLDGQGFDLLIGVMIIANAFVMSTQLEYEGVDTAQKLGMSTDTNDWPGAKMAFLVLQHLFTIIFVLEVIARVLRWGLQYYKSLTNFMDLCIVVISVLDLYVLPWMGASLPNISFLRLLRVMKLFKVLRIIRVFRIFRHLRVLIHSTISSIGALVWSMVFLALIQLITSILITQSLQSWLRDSANDLETRKYVYDRFGTFFRSCITLFEMTLAPGAWAKIGRILIYEVSWVYVLFFAIYVPMVTFGITRVMTALFLRETLAAANSDKDMMVEERLRSQKMLKENLKALFNKFDLDENGVITLDELDTALKDGRLAMWTQIIDVDAYAIVDLFELLDKDHNGAVTFDEFSKGIKRLRGGAKSIDVISVLQQNAEMFKTLQRLTNAVQGIVALSPATVGSRSSWKTVSKQNRRLQADGSTLVDL